MSRAGDPLDLEYMDVLEQLGDNLKDLLKDVEDYDEGLDVHPKRKEAKSRLRQMRSPLDDLAVDLNSSELREAHDDLGKGIDNIKDQDEQDAPKKELEDGIQELIDEVDEILHRQPRKNRGLQSQGITPGGPHAGDETEMKMSPNDIRDGAHTKGKSNLLEDDPYKKKQTMTFKQFDNDFPIVERIVIRGGFLSKKAICQMRYKDSKFDRKMKYFKWLSRMLLLFVDVDKVVPEIFDRARFSTIATVYRPQMN